jgi:hypothetical protein
MFVVVGVVGGRWPAYGGAIKCDPIASESDSHCRPRPIDLVICLDTSGSMEGLIDSARARLWDIVSALGRARPVPQLRVGLITYGSPNRADAANGWVALQSNLTSDLDSVYARMMSFATNGGDEYVGWSLRRALDWMQWSPDPDALKLIFVAGNESADQGAHVFNFRYVSEEARRRGIIINAIYCGNRTAGMNEHWDQVAACGGGTYSAIDMQCGTVQIATPQDRLLLELNMKLNATYVPYGSRGEAGHMQQRAQDANAERVGVASAASRVAAKGTKVYDNAHWDLVDGVAQGKVEVKDVEEADLPAAMRAMPVEERAKFVESQARERADIQKQIAELTAAREQFLRNARANAAGGNQALDQAILESIRTQAQAKGFAFE